MVLGQAVEVVVEGVVSRRREDTEAAAKIPTWRIAPTAHPTLADHFRHQVLRACQHATARRPEPFEKETLTRSNGAARSARVRALDTAAFHSRAPSR
jgi:hypothetical protein